MKRLLPIFGLLLWMHCPCAAQEGHRLIIYSEDSTRFTVSVNELQENETYAARVEVIDIVEDRPELDLTFERPGIPPIHIPQLKLGDPRAANNPAYAAVYAVHKSGKKYRLQLVSRVRQTMPHEVSIRENADGTSVEISNPGNVHVRTHR